jgi:hypothetical protein
MSTIRIDRKKAEQFVALMLREEKSMSPAEADAFASRICGWLSAATTLSATSDLPVKKFSEMQASELVRLVAEPRPVGDSVKAAISRAARRLGWSPTRTKSIWYEEAHRIDASEVDQLRSRAWEQAVKQEGVAQAIRQTDKKDD